MSLQSEQALTWVRNELTQAPDRAFYNILKDIETEALVVRYKEGFEEAADRSAKYGDFTRAVERAQQLHMDDTGGRHLYRKPKE